MTRRRDIRAHGVGAVLLVFALLAPGARAASLEQISLGAGTGNAAQTATIDGFSRDGTIVIFDTSEGMTPEDTDGLPDIYSRANGVTTRISLGPLGGNTNSGVNYRAVSDDGAHVIFETGEPLVSTDIDGRCYAEAELRLACSDVYERVGNTTNLVSTSATSPNTEFNARYRGMSADGLHLFFSTGEQLVPSDTDDATDIYERFAGNTTLVSTGPASTNTDDDAYFKGSSENGSRVFIQTAERLTSADTDSEADVYERAGGATTLLSTGSTGGNGSFPVSFRGSSTDGGRVFFETEEPLTGSDTDARNDVYQRTGGATSLISTGPAGGNGAKDAFFADASNDGTRVWFETEESLVAGDTDARQDVYERTGAVTGLLSTGPTGGSGDFEANFQGASDDGGRVWIGTFEALAPTDTDAVFDIYERSGGATSQVSLGPNGGNGSSDAFFDEASADGTHVYFTTAEALVSSDTDAYPDVYQRYAGTTTLISVAAGATPTSYASIVGMTGNASRIFLQTGDKLLSSDTDTQTDVYASTDLGIYARPKGATPFLVPLVVAYKDCTSANTVHGAPLSGPSCNPPVPTSNWLTVGTPDANGEGAKSVGALAARVVVGNSATAADEADVKLQLSITDVRNKSGLGDYAGELDAKLDVRVTDRLNGSAPVDPGTIADFPFGFTGVCATTADTTVGSTCTANTTADAIVPGVIAEGQRAVWQIGTVQVFDGGSDGVATTGPNTLFERQGIFVP